MRVSSFGLRPHQLCRDKNFDLTINSENLCQSFTLLLEADDAGLLNLLLSATNPLNARRNIFSINYRTNAYPSNCSFAEEESSINLDWRLNLSQYVENNAISTILPSKYLAMNMLS